MDLADVPSEYRARIVRRGECWSWTGCLTSGGIPILSHSSNLNIGRRLFELCNNIQLENSVHCRRTCHDSTCVNPHHKLTGPVARPARIGKRTTPSLLDADTRAAVIRKWSAGTTVAKLMKHFQVTRATIELVLKQHLST